MPMRAMLLLPALMVAVATDPAHGNTELCRVEGLVVSMLGQDGPLENCREGDVVHFQIDQASVVPAVVAARYCDFSRTIHVEQGVGSIAHLVCVYQWKWAKSATPQPHPDQN